ncbi:hypothetical protein KUTeg_019472 [Tegillarca granosa]|uniref:Uncharacterized protein n=1 Tax=Tegillarca granosa TaxID=220873 RepID=A0ABQ9EF57_TEGGR|nr:hypothetical protein KUTeg_019472 [Tegillarca granosa]
MDLVTSYGVRVSEMTEETSVNFQKVLQRQSDDTFDPLVVIQFSSKAKPAAIEWMIAKIQRKKSAGGAELDVRTAVLHYKQQI